MSLFGTVLVPHDGSPLADTALPYAEEVVRATGASLELLRVLEESRPIFDPGKRELHWFDPSKPRAELDSVSLLGPSAKKVEDDGIVAKLVVRVGDPRSEILAEAETLDRPLILMASHGRGGLSRVVLGSVATRVLQLAPCPVLLVRSSEEEQPEKVALQRVTVLLDGSELSELALPYAVELAKALGGQLNLVRIAETYRDEVPASAPHHVFTSPSYKAMLEQFEVLERETRLYLQNTAARLEGASIPVTWEALSGDPWRQVLRYAELDHPDLIVMTTHGHGGLARWFYGSVADRLLTSVTTPLLLIRAAAAKS